MQNYLFIGGPWDGMWKEAPNCGSVSFAERPPLVCTPIMKKSTIVKVGMKIHTYTLRRISTPLSFTEVYVEESISDRHLLTKLLSVYERTQ